MLNWTLAPVLQNEDAADNDNKQIHILKSNMNPYSAMMVRN